MIRGAKVASGNRARGCADKENDPLHVRSNAHVSAGPSAEPLAGQRAQEAERSWKSGISRSSSVLMWARPTTGPPPQAVAGAGALPGGTMSGYSYMSGPGPHTPAGFLQATATGTLKGGATGGLGGAAGHGLAHVFGNAIGRSVMADPRILSGHGGIHASSGSTFTVPKGVTVRFYSPHDTRISDSVGNTIETGTRRWPFSNVQPTPYEGAGPGTIVPDYLLFPPTAPPVLNVKETPITVTNTSGVKLSDLIKKGGVGVYDWAACRYVVD